MESLFYFKDIVWAYYPDDQYLLKHQDGNTYISYSSFGANERVLKFIDFRGYLYACICDETADNGRLIRLDKVNSGNIDTWTEVLTTSDLDTAPEIVEYFGDSIYLMSNDEVWSYDGTILTSKTTSMPTGYLDRMYWSVYFEDKIYIYGNDIFTDDYIYSYDGDSTFEQLTNSLQMVFLGSFNPIGKRLMVEMGGKLYTWYYESAIFNLQSYDIKSRKLETQLLSPPSAAYWPTVMFKDSGVLFLSIINSSTYKSNIMSYVPTVYTKEINLISGEGKVLNSLLRLNADPVFSVIAPKLDKVPFYNTYPVIGVLGGEKQPVIKYGNRLEVYTDLMDISGLAGRTLKEIMDELCSMGDNFFYVDSYNRGIVERRGLVGYSDKFITITDSTDTGDALIKNVNSMEIYPHVFQRITINWNNRVWGDNNPVIVGSINTQSLASIDFSSDFINDPISAKNIGLFMLGSIDSTERMLIELAFMYFIEGGESVSFDIQDGPFIVDKEREWKVVSIEHDRNNMVSMLTVLERSLFDEREVA